MQDLSICVDIGGTFTDLVLADTTGNLVAVEKVLTTPGDLESGAIQGIEQLLSGQNIEPERVSVVVHATTQTSNTLIERSGAKTALVTTEGFADILEMGRESRYDVYDLFIKLPAPLVAREHRFEVPERILANGDLLRSIDGEAVRLVAEKLISEGIESVAVCFLHAYRNPMHERQVKDLLRDAGYEGPILLSSDVCPEIREFERAATTVANAYLSPRMASYLRNFESRLRKASIDAPFQLFSSYGGRLTVHAAERRPVEMLECGGAAGVMVAAAMAQALEWPLALSFDMGGTTAKAALIKDGQPQLTRSYEVARMARFVSGSGLPISASAIDLIEIGAGGGSLAAVDALGLITVGPESAGGDPGPACYGRGGEKPTVADADLILGYLDPEDFSGGQLTLDVAAARVAIDEHIARPLGISIEDAAKGIHDIVVEQMSRAARLHAVSLGYDPRKIGIIAFGGSGPVHACALADRLDAPEVVVIPDAGVGAAVGLAGSPPVCVVARSGLSLLHEVDWRIVEKLLDEMKEEALADIAAKMSSDDIDLLVSCDMRYRGQGYEINVPFSPPPYSSDSMEALLNAFTNSYRERYGIENPGVNIEIVSWRLEVRSGAMLVPGIKEKASESGKEMLHRRKRNIRFENDFVETVVCHRDDIDPAVSLVGPAVITETNTTTLIPPGKDFTIDNYGNIRIRIREMH